MKSWTTASVLAGALALFFWAAPPLAADGPEYGGPGAQGAFGQQMGEMREIMHEATFTSEAVAEGVQVTVTGSEPALVEAIQTRFGEAPAAPYPGTVVTVARLENGVALKFTSANPETVGWLQARGAELAYGTLRDNMHTLMAGQGYAPGRGHGGGWMHGPGAGHGGGWMHGPGGEQGRGWMHGSGWGGGWMHGPGWGESAPETE